MARKIDDDNDYCNDDDNADDDDDDDDGMLQSGLLNSVHLEDT